MSRALTKTQIEAFSALAFEEVERQKGMHAPQYSQEYKVFEDEILNLLIRNGADPEQAEAKAFDLGMETLGIGLLARRRGPENDVKFLTRWIEGLKKAEHDAALGRGQLGVVQGRLLVLAYKIESSLPRGSGAPPSLLFKALVGCVARAWVSLSLSVTERAPRSALGELADRVYAEAESFAAANGASRRIWTAQGTPDVRTAITEALKATAA